MPHHRVVGGKLKDNKGINLPGVEVSAPALTEKDRDDLRWALRHDVDSSRCASCARRRRRRRPRRWTTRAGASR